MRVRTTKGINLVTMPPFTLVDDWTQQSNSHRVLGFPWIGNTAFQEVSDSMIVFDPPVDGASPDESSDMDRPRKGLSSLNVVVKSSSSNEERMPRAMVGAHVVYPDQHTGMNSGYCGVCMDVDSHAGNGEGAGNICNDLECQVSDNIADTGSVDQVCYGKSEFAHMCCAARDTAHVIAADEADTEEVGAATAV